MMKMKGCNVESSMFPNSFNDAVDKIIDVKAWKAEQWSKFGGRKGTREQYLELEAIELIHKKPMIIAWPYVELILSFTLVRKISSQTDIVIKPYYST